MSNFEKKLLKIFKIFCKVSMIGWSGLSALGNVCYLNLKVNKIVSYFQGLYSNSGEELYCSLTNLGFPSV